MKTSHKSHSMKKNLRQCLNRLLATFVILLAALPSSAARSYVFALNGDGESISPSYYYGDYQKGEPTRFIRKYVRVSSTQSDWSGTYLLVGQTDANTHYAYTGGFSTSSSFSNAVLVLSASSAEQRKTIISPSNSALDVTIEQAGQDSGTNYYFISYVDGEGNRTYLGISSTSGTIVTALTTSKPSISNDVYRWSIAAGYSISSFGDLLVKSKNHSTAYLDFNGGTSKRFAPSTSVPSGTSSSAGWGPVKLYRKAQDYTVTYAANNGSGSTIIDSTYINTETVIVRNNTFTAPTGKGFVRWNTAPDGSGTYYEPGDEFSMPSNDVTLYAQWYNLHDINYAVTPNGTVTTSPANEAPEGLTVTILPDPNPGYQVDGVSVKDGDNNPVVVTRNQFVMPANDVTVTVTYREPTHKYIRVTNCIDSLWAGKYILAFYNDSYGEYGFSGTLGTTTSYHSDGTPITLSSNRDTITNIMNSVPVYVEYAGRWPSNLGSDSPGYRFTDSSYYYMYFKQSDGKRTYLNSNSSSARLEFTRNQTTNPASTATTKHYFKWFFYEYGGDFWIHNYSVGSYYLVYRTSSSYKDLYVNSGDYIEGHTYGKPYLYKLDEVLYKINIDNAGHGTISLESDAIPNYKDYVSYAGSTISATVTPDTGYELDEFYYVEDHDPDAIHHDIDQEALTFTMPEDNIHIYVSFSLKQYTINCDPFPGVITTSPSGSAVMETPVTISVALNDGYKLKSLKVTDSEAATVAWRVVGSDTIFDMPADDVTITAVAEYSKYIQHHSVPEDSWAGNYLMSFNYNNTIKRAVTGFASTQWSTGNVTLSTNLDTITAYATAPIVFTVEYGGVWTEADVDVCGTNFVGHPYYYITAKSGTTKRYYGSSNTTTFTSYDEGSSFPDPTQISSLKNIRWCFIENENGFFMKNFYSKTSFIYGIGNTSPYYVKIRTNGNNENTGYTQAAGLRNVCLYKGSGTLSNINVNIEGNGWVDLSTPSSKEPLGLIRSSSNYVAYNGTAVTITTKTEPNVDLTSLTVIDSEDHSIALTEVSAGVYRFAMPDKDVTINATFDQLDCMAEGQYDISSPKANYGNSTCSRYPYSISDAHSYKQFLFSSATNPSSSIPSQISSIGFMYYVNNTGVDIDWKESVTIYMGDTTTNALSDWVDINSLTEVYSGPMNFTHPVSNAWDWTDFTFNRNGNKFVHDQSKNLIVVIHDHSGATSTYTNRGFFYQEADCLVQMYNVSSTGYGFNDDGKPTVDNTVVTKTSTYFYPITHFCKYEEPSATDTWAEYVTSQPAGYSESGSTITISSAEGLAWLISVVNGLNNQTADDLYGKTVSLTADLDMSEYIWVPIGTAAHPFSGMFDGNYHTIKGLHIANASEAEAAGTPLNTGLFGYTVGGAIKNVSVTADFVSSKSGTTPIPCLGILAAHIGGTTVEFCHVSGTLSSTTEMSVGGLVGAMAINSTRPVVRASSAAVTITSSGTNSNVGGLVGYAAPASTIENSLANSTFSVSNTSYQGNLIGCIHGGADATNQVTVNNCYALNTSGNLVGYKDNQQMSLTNLYAPTANSVCSDATGKFSSVAAYHYGDYTTNNTVTISGTTKPFVNWLNENVGANFKWIRPKGSTVINEGYPVIVRTSNTSATTVAATTGSDKLLYYGTAADMITKFSGNSSANIYVYGSGDLGSAAPTSAFLFIDEDASVTQNSNAASNATTFTATVGITIDNSANNGEMKRDWHCFATPLQNEPLGITYTGYTFNSGQTTPVYGYDETPATINSQMSFSGGYFPTDFGLNDNKGDIDFYDFSEPDYHWINLKRNPISHFHSDGDHDPITYTTDGNLKSGSGYLLAIGSDAAANKKVYLSSNGTLKNGNVTVTVTNKGAHLKGYNFLGNPYQSYLDFNRFADYYIEGTVSNADSLWTSGSTGSRSYLIYDADEGRFNEYLYVNDGTTTGQTFSQGAAQTASQYIHPHQAFFVVKNSSTSNDEAIVTFTNDMRTTTETSSFRDIRPSYPLVNLFCTDSEGKQEVSVIEVERPIEAGSLKMKDMLNGKGNMYIHWDGEDYSNMFIEGTPEYVPVWFKASEESIFTMSWNTANDNFGYLHLIDNLTGNDIDMLAAESYVFQSKPSDSKARFRLVFKPLGIEEETSTEASENFAFINGSELVVNGEGELSLIDLNGRVLTTEHLSGQQSHIAMPNVAVGMYMLRLANSDGVKVQKIVVRK